MNAPKGFRDGAPVTFALLACVFYLVPLLYPPMLHAEATNVAILDGEPVLIPQIVFVGDRARLVIPIGGVPVGNARGSSLVDIRERLPHSKEVAIVRAELERRGGAGRTESAKSGDYQILLDFIAYAPGVIVLPDVEVGGLRISGLQVEIASLLDLEGGNSELSPPAATLAAAGTAPLLYGLLFAFIVFAASSAFLARQGFPLLQDALERRRRSLAVRAMRRVLVRLHEKFAELDANTVFSMLLPALREYLSLRSGVNCRSLTPGELSQALDGVLPEGRNRFVFLTPDTTNLETLFRLGDAVRFGGGAARASRLDVLLAGVSDLVDRIEAPSPGKAARGGDGLHV